MKAAIQTVLLALLFGALTAQAHQPGLSSLAVQMRDDRVLVELTLARIDTERFYPLDADKSGAVSPEEFEQARFTLEELSLTMLELTRDGEPLPPDSPTVRLDDSDAVHFDFSFAIDGAGKLRVRSAILHKLPP